MRAGQGTGELGAALSITVLDFSLLFLDENSLVPPAPVDSDGESDNSDRVPVPSFQNSFSQAIEAAFMKLDTPATSDALSGKSGELTQHWAQAQPYMPLFLSVLVAVVMTQALSHWTICPAYT